MQLNLQAIAEAVSGSLMGISAEEAQRMAFSRISINTRTLQAGDVYIAIQGQVYDGHDFVAQAEQAGAKAIIAHKTVLTHLPVVLVKDTHQALGELASYWRRLLNPKMLGVTGSNGKTTVKEMLAAILAVNAPALFTQGNLNNDIGVPLTLLQLQSQHQYAVIEMGANHAGEIAYTSQCAGADVAVITNVGDAHLEGFGSRAGIAKAKGEIIETLKASGTVILNRDDAFYDYWLQLAGPRKRVSFGLTAAADVRASHVRTTVVNHAFQTQFTLESPAGHMDIELNLAGQHNVANALAASAAVMAMGIPLSQIKTGLAQLKPVKGRLQPVVSQQGNIVIDDSYNANPSSLNAALAVLRDCPGEHWLALGAFGEMGPDSEAIHRDLAQHIKAFGITRVFATGEFTQATVAAFGAGAEYFPAQEDLIAALDKALRPGVSLLVKGSRSQKMESVVLALINSSEK